MTFPDFVKRIFRKKEAGNRLLPAFTSANYYTQTFGELTPDNFSVMIGAYRSWIYICCSKNSVNVASVPLRLYVAKKKNSKKCIVETKNVNAKVKDYIFNSPTLSNLECVRKAVDIEEVLEHPFLTLLKNVNPYTNRFELFELTELFLELVGNAYWYVLKNKIGLPQEIWTIPSQHMSILPDKDNFIKGYVYRNVFGTTAIPFNTDEIVHFKFPSPKSIYYGQSPLSAVADAYNTNENIARYANSVFKNMGMPEGVLYTEQSLGDDEFERIKQEWKNIYGGVTNAGKTALLEKGLKYQPISFTPKELGFLIGRNATIQEIAAAYGIPVSKLTTKDVNLANAYVGERQYQRDTALPRLRRLEQKLNEQLTPIYDDNIFCAYDNPILEDRELMLREREINLRMGFSAINEERAKIGEQPVPWGSEPILGISVAPFSGASVTENQLPSELPKKRVTYRLRQKTI